MTYTPLQPTWADRIADAYWAGGLQLTPLQKLGCYVALGLCLAALAI